MARITIRLDDELYVRLIDQARALRTTPSAFLRDILVRFEGADPSGHHARFDALQATLIQTLAILGALAAKTSPGALEKGMAEARAMLRERGLLDPQDDPDGP